MTAKRFTVDCDGRWWDKIKHEYVTLDSLFRLVEELDYTINEMAKTIRIYDDGYIDLNKKYKKLAEENEQLKKEISIFEGEDAGHYQRWVAQIKKYVDESNPNFEYDEDFIIKIALSYTLQSLRNGESLKRFQWEYKELEE